MCGRYQRRSDKQKIVEAFHLGNVDGLALEFAPDYNAAPQSLQPVIVWDKQFGARSLHMMFSIRQKKLLMSKLVALDFFLKASPTLPPVTREDGVDRLPWNLVIALCVYGKGDLMEGRVDMAYPIFCTSEIVSVARQVL
jgi:hypothetical protein